MGRRNTRGRQLNMNDRHHIIILDLGKYFRKKLVKPFLKNALMRMRK